jgi:hypothetical protein
MTTTNAVHLIDPTARVCTWGSERDGLAYWVKGAGWETKLTYSPERAWELAVEILAAMTVVA